MKKLLLRTVTIISIIVLSVASFAGCGLITTNTEMDMAQKIAKVRIATDVDEEYIEKREMISAYMSYGYYYVANYNMTSSAVYEMILKNLVQNRVIIQQARKELAKTYNQAIAATDGRTEFLDYFVENATAAKTAIDYSNGSDETLKKYLTEYEIAEANYNVIASINSMIDSYLEEGSHAGHDHDHDHDHEEESEDETFSARSNPSVTDSESYKEYELRDVEKGGKITDDQYKVADVTLKTEGGWEALKAAYEAAGKTAYDLNLEVYKKATIDLSTSEREKAKNKAIKALKNNGLIGESENVKDVREYSYFKRALTNQYETLVVSKFEDSLITEAESRVTDEALWAQYKAEYETQKANYTVDVSAYETALEAVNDDKFVLSNPYEGYGYVANLLIGFSTEQSNMLSAYSSKAGVTPADVENYRKTLLSQVYAKDQRTTWVQSSYGTYDAESNSFAFDDKYFKSDVKENAALKSALGSFIGKLDFDKEHITENSDKVDVTTYTFNNVDPTAIAFKDFFNTYVTGLIPGMTEKYFDADETGKIDLTEDARNAFDDLLYAFGTDPGSLGNYYGYLYSPVTSASKYVPEFAKAAKAVVEQGEGAYTIVATDYGYHIILCTKVVESDDKNAENYMNKGTEEECKKAFIAALNDENSLASKYKKLKLDSVTSDIVSKIANNFINGYMEGNMKNADGSEASEKCVTYFEKTYADLITEPTSSND